MLLSMSLSMFSAIPLPPCVVTITTSSVLLEFHAANESTTSYVIEYARERMASPLEFETGSTVRPIDDQPSYSASQGGLIPGATYHIRIVPYVGSSRGTPSEAVQVRISKPGM